MTSSADVIVRMQNERLRALVHTPTFLVVAGSLPGLARAASIEAGTLLGVVFAVSIMAMALMARPMRALCGRVAYVPVMLMLSASVAILMGFGVRIFDPVLHEQLGMYVPLAAVNGCAMAFVCNDAFMVTRTCRFRMVAAVCAGACTVASLTFIGFMNEIFSTGMIFGMTHYELADAPIAIFGTPAGSLLLLTLVAAFVQSIEHAIASSRNAREHCGSKATGGGC